MSFVGRTLAQTDVTPFTPQTYDAVFGNSSSLPGLPSASTDAVLGGIPSAWACTVAIGEDIGKVPLQMFETIGDSKRLAREHPLYDLLHDQPNADLGALEFREWMTAIAVNRGKAIAEIVPGARGPVSELIPLHPDYITTEIDRQGRRQYRYQDPVQRRERVLFRDELFVLRGRFGLGVVTFARRNFELQLSMQRLSTEMYGRGLRSPGYLSTEKTLSKPTREKLREALDAYMGNGERAGRPMLLDEGMEWKTIALSLEDAEFLATLQNADVWTAQWYRVPMHKLQRLSPGTHASLQQQSTDYVVDSILGWAVRWEQAIRRDLILNPRRFTAEHNLEGLLRGDAETRYKAYQIGVSFGWLTRAEVREKENMNPIPGLDKPLLPLNMAAQVAGGSPGVGPIDGATAQYLRVLVRDGAARIVRKETAQLGKLAERGVRGEQWVREVRAFYREHAEFTARVLRMPDEAAEAWTETRARDLIERGPTALEHPESEAIADLTELARDKSEPLQVGRPQLPSGLPTNVGDLVEMGATA